MKDNLCKRYCQDIGFISQYLDLVDIDGYNKLSAYYSSVSNRMPQRGDILTGYNLGTDSYSIYSIELLDNIENNRWTCRILNTVKLGK